MLMDIGFLVALIVGIAAAVGCIVLTWHGNWFEAAGCGIVFIAAIVVAFWLAMTTLLKNTHPS